jgi:hypothetical protein
LRVSEISLAFDGPKGQSVPVTGVEYQWNGKPG